jgi:hypothetical protein
LHYFSQVSLVRDPIFRAIGLLGSSAEKYIVTCRSVGTAISGCNPDLILTYDDEVGRWNILQTNALLLFPEAS